jgi:ribonuclease BN (tRNA processing enzyme)
MNRLVTLGVKGGPSIRARGAMPTASLLELDGRRIVVDCGLGVSRGLVGAGMALRDLDLIFITHLHSDHILELGGLIHTAWVGGLPRPVTVLGPPGLAAYWAGFQAAMAADIHLRVTDDGRAPLAGLVRIEEIAPGPLAVPGLRASALAVHHPPVAHAFAFRFDGTAAVVFSGDTAHFPPLADFARGCDVLVHEAMLPEGIDEILRKTGGGARLRAHLEASHTTVDDAARIAAAAGARHLVLNHLVPVDDPRFTAADWQARAARHYAGPVTVGRDGLEVAL